MGYDLNHGMLKLFSFFIAISFCSALNATQTYNFDLIKKGVENNNTLLIVGGIQGDEPGGFISASLIATHYEITKGSVWVVPNLNFYSIIKRDRGPYGDMNRKFAQLSPKDPEYNIIQKIKHHIVNPQVKFIVNLHDGSGFFREKYIDKNHQPLKWGQSLVIDQHKLNNIKKYSNVGKISKQITQYLNKHLLKDEDIFRVKNTHTRFRKTHEEQEMAKTLTYYAITHGKAAIGHETSKNLNVTQRVYYKLVALEKVMDIMGIEFKRKFKLSQKGVFHAINNDIYISLYNNKIRLPLSKIRNILNYFPVTKNGIIEFKASNPLLTIIKKDNIYTIQYGNRRLSRLKANYQNYDHLNQTVKFNIDGKSKDVQFGEIIDVRDAFLVEENKNYRINVIGYTNKSRIETNIKIKRSQISKRFSIDTRGHIYRVEYYSNDKFAGMILVKFKG